MNELLSARPSPAMSLPAAPAHALTMQQVALLDAKLAQTDLTSFLRCRPICRILPRQPPEIRFHEITVSLDDLIHVLLPGTDLGDHGWFRLQLAAGVDQRLLSMIERSTNRELPASILLPLHLTTLLGESFLAFDRRLPMARRGTIVIGVDVVEIFTDLADWVVASSYYRSRGYPLVLIASSAGAARRLRWPQLGARWVKAPLRCDGDATCVFDERSDCNGPMILSEINTQAAFERGRSVGVSLFQGQYIDQLLHLHAGRAQKTIG